jgi:hypothetical protein
VVNGAVGVQRSYTAAGTFNCCGSNHLGNKRNDGDIGVGVLSDGLHAVPNAGIASLTLNLGATVTLGSIAICNGYRNPDTNREPIR